MNLFIRFLALVLGVFPLLGREILMTDYQNITIATDLEPDDLLALHIIFHEANAIYKEKGGKYPIDLIIVGEGNTAMKRKRMEIYLDYFHLPSGVSVPIVEGKSSNDNVFSYDGVELGLQPIPYKENGGEEAISALTAFFQEAKNPLLIQIKPAPELLKIPSDLLAKTTVLFYGGFNFRKTTKDLQELIDLFASQFKKIGIIESHGLFGKESSVYKEYPWTDPIRIAIEQSPTDFMGIFRKLVHYWNKYLLFAELLEIKESLARIPELTLELAKINQLILYWDESLFLDLYVELLAKSREEKLLESLRFAYQLKPSSGVQFTLADIAVALALADKNHFFQSNPVTLKVNPKGHFETIPNPNSNVFYYAPVNRETFISILYPYIGN